MVVGEIPEQVDLLVVGGGPGGYVAAIVAARLGRSVVLVDAEGEDGLGGVCVNVGCIPSKALIELTHAAHALDGWASRGLVVPEGARVDMAAFQEWKGHVVSGLNGGVRQLLAAAGVEVTRGYFRFTRKDQGAVEFGDERPPVHLRFTSCILATGSRPTEVPSLPRDGKRVLDSTDALALNHVPERMAIVGGGYIGVELGTAFAKAGAHVTMIDTAERVLAGLPSLASAPVARRLKELGVDVRVGTTVVSDNGETLTLEAGGQREQVAVDVIVVAVGRTPNTRDLGLEVLGVTPMANGLLDVGSDLRIAPHVAAIGDITPGPALAHKASAQGHVAAEVLSGHEAHFSPMAVPAVVFCDPEVAVTGYTEEQARAAGLDVVTSSFPMAASGRARTMDESAGGAHVVHTVEGVVVGAILVGPHVSELIGEVTLAIEMGARLADLAATIHPHPTVSETLVEAAAVGLGLPVHIVPKRARR